MYFFFIILHKFKHCLTLQACELLFHVKYASDFGAYQILKIICLMLMLKKF